MKTIYQGKSDHGGVYKISNAINSRIYIGSTSCFRKRFKAHKCDLNLNRHLNKFMQNDFNKTGSQNFLFEILEVVSGDKNKRLEREQHYIDFYYDNQKQCYNLAKKANDTRSGTRNKEKINRETDKRCLSKSLEQKQIRSKAMKQHYKDNPEERVRAANNAKNNLWKNHSANITLVHKDTKEEVHVTTSLREFALSRNLSYKALHLVVAGKTKSSGGWYIKGTNPAPISQKGQKRKPLCEEHKNSIALSVNRGKYIGKRLINIHTSEEIEVGANVVKFCEENNLNLNKIRKLLYGSTKISQNYMLKNY